MRSFTISVVLFAVSMLVISCSDPKDMKLSSDIHSWESDPKLKKAVEGLTKEDKELFTAYVVRSVITSAFTGDSMKAISLGDAIERQKRFEEQKRIEQAKQEALRKELEQKRTAAIAKMQGTLTVSLLGLSFQDSDWRSGIYTDYFVIRVGFKNLSDKDMTGVKGRIVLKDIFGEVIKSIGLSDDGGVKAGSTKVYKGTLDYNQFMDADQKLKATEFSKINFEWEPEVYLFNDGTKLTMSDLGLGEI